MDLNILLLVLAHGCHLTVSSYQCQSEFQKRLTRCIEGHRLPEKYPENDHHIMLCKKAGDLLRCIETVRRAPSCPLNYGQQQLISRITNNTSANYGGENCPFNERDYRRVRCNRRSQHSSQICSLPERIRTSEDEADFRGYCSRVRCYHYEMAEAGCNWDLREFEHTVTKYAKACRASAIVLYSKALMVLLTVLIFVYCEIY